MSSSSHGLQKVLGPVQLWGIAVGLVISGEYFGRYGQTQGWRAWPGLVEGRPAVLIQQHERTDARPDYFVVLGWSGERVSTIRDFLFARYVLADAEHSSL